MLLLATLGYGLFSLVLGGTKTKETAPTRVAKAAPAQPAVQPTPATPVNGKAVPTAPEPVELKLQAIMFSGIQSSAIINGKTLRLGEEIEGARVLKITPEQVTLDRGGKQELLVIR